MRENIYWYMNSQQLSVAHQIFYNYFLPIIIVPLKYSGYKKNSIYNNQHFFNYSQIRIIFDLILFYNCLRN